HPYAADLDLFGRGSVFQRLCAARTRLGEDMLAEWLAGPASVQDIRARHAAVEELRSALDLRERLAIIEAELGEDLDQNRLRLWAARPPQPFDRRTRITAIVLGTAAVLGLACWIVFGTVSPLIVVLMIEIVFLFRHRGRIRELAQTADDAASGLATLADVLSVIEEQRFRSAGLVSLRDRLNVEGQPPSVRIARLRGLIQNLSGSLQNQFFAPIALLLCLPIALVHRIEVWRAEVGPHIPEWLDAVGEFEALSSLAGYAFEHPADPLPEFLADGPCFDAEQVGHPLLPDDVCVRNDFRLGGELRLVMVSGSNMSGKSTLLRTVGVNTVLALAGAPVRAGRLRLSPLQVGTAMRVSDSLQQGASLFYAVVRRLKAVADLAEGQRPLLFLLDEILQGTNSHDRRIGAEAVIRTLAGRGAVGLVTTHDLALTDIVDVLGEQAKNIHFEDHLEDGRMTFDYRIRPGVVQKSNALDLMRAVGLEV
ncbi:MAG: MutS-related protein, partial [Planctomycetaceae bacterium]